MAEIVVGHLAWLDVTRVAKLDPYLRVLFLHCAHLGIMQLDVNVLHVDLAAERSYLLLLLFLRAQPQLSLFLFHFNFSICLVKLPLQVVFPVLHGTKLGRHLIDFSGDAPLDFLQFACLSFQCLNLLIAPAEPLSQALNTVIKRSDTGLMLLSESFLAQLDLFHGLCVHIELLLLLVKICDQVVNADRLLLGWVLDNLDGVRLRGHVPLDAAALALAQLILQLFVEDFQRSTDLGWHASRLLLRGNSDDLGRLRLRGLVDL